MSRENCTQNKKAPDEESGAFGRLCNPGAYVPQQTGVWCIMKQQVQPSFIMEVRHSQHAWIISQLLASPLVQVMWKPFSVISHLHIPMVKLQLHIIMPFIMQ